MLVQSGTAARDGANQLSSPLDPLLEIDGVMGGDVIGAMSEMDLLTAVRNYLKKLYQENHGVTARSGLPLGRVVNEVVRRLRKLKPRTGDPTKRFT